MSNPKLTWDDLADATAAQYQMMFEAQRREFFNLFGHRYVVGVDWAKRIDGPKPGEVQIEPGVYLSGPGIK